MSEIEYKQKWKTMPGQIITMGEKPKAMAGKPANEITEINDGMTYIIKTAGGSTLVINPSTVVGRAPQVGNLVMDYCAECKRYKYNSLKKCSYRSEYLCTPGTLVYFKEQPANIQKSVPSSVASLQEQPKKIEEKEPLNTITNCNESKKITIFMKLKNMLHMR